MNVYIHPSYRPSIHANLEETAKMLRGILKKKCKPETRLFVKARLALYEDAIVNGIPLVETDE